MVEWRRFNSGLHLNMKRLKVKKPAATTVILEQTNTFDSVNVRLLLALIDMALIFAVSLQVKRKKANFAV